MSNRSIHHHAARLGLIVPELVRFIVIDLFCGAGGWTEGVEQATDSRGNRLAVVIVGVNHDKDAIAVHAENHPETVHFVEDVRDQQLPKKILQILIEARKLYPNAIVLFHASLECTNFSNAKGGKPRDADSRSLAEYMPLYLDVLGPDLFTVENVREFMAWGPLTAEGKPESRTKGRDYQRWIREVCEYGYTFDHRLLNAADFGAYTSRLRFFGVFARPGIPIAWPAPTHSKKTTAGMFGSLKPWLPVRDVLDLTDEGQSIFTRKKPLSEKTLERIHAGLIKHVAGGEEAFLVKYLGNDAKTGINNGVSVNEPCIAVTTQNRLYLAQASFLSKYYSGHPEAKNISVDGPAGAMTTTDSHALVSAFIVQRQNDPEGSNPAGRVVDIGGPARTITTTGGNQELVTAYLTSYYGNVCTNSLDEPAATITTKDRLSLIQAEYFIDQQYGNSEPASVDAPAATITANPKLNLVEVDGFLTNPGWFGNNSALDQPAPTIVARQDQAPVGVVTCDKFMINYYSGGGQTESIDGPTTALMTIPKQRLVECETMLLNNQHNNVPKSVDEPASTILTGNHHYLLNAQFDHILQPVNYVAPTITADRHWPYLVTTADGLTAIQVFESDSAALIKIKQFMAAYGIVDVKMRMLNVPELKRIQGFPDSYVLRGTQTNMKKFIGNSVVPNVPRRWVEALAKKNQVA